VIAPAGYPSTPRIPALSHVLSLLALKLTSTRRVSHVYDIAADPGAALFAGLTALPKATALATCSCRLQHSRQAAFLAALDKAALAAGLTDGRCYLDAISMAAITKATAACAVRGETDAPECTAARSKSGTSSPGPWMTASTNWPISAAALGWLDRNKSTMTCALSGVMAEACSSFPRCTMFPISLSHCQRNAAGCQGHAQS
jgi:hypothetical protein